MPILRKIAIDKTSEFVSYGSNTTLPQGGEGRGAAKPQAALPGKETTKVKTWIEFMPSALIAGP
jgi:hypothetical protein